MQNGEIIQAISTGDIVLASAGRDTGRYFLVTSVIDELYVTIANGRSRRLEKPKRKKVKHLTLVQVLKDAPRDNEPYIAYRKDERLTNSILRKILAYYMELSEREKTAPEAEKLTSGS